MDVHQTSSISVEMSSTLANDGQMVDNVMTLLPIELTNVTGTHLHQLNEDCLLEIFSRNPLTPMDLCSLGETCKRFKQITQRLFSKGFAIKCCLYECVYTCTFSSKDHSKLECTFQDTERILKNFGPHLSELHMEGDLALVNLIAKYCDGITLKRLEMNELEIVEGVTQQLNSIFQRLLELRVGFCENGTALLSNAFPILERFHFDSDDGSIREKHNIETLCEFVRRHRCLKSIEILGEAFDICKLLRAISCSCNELVELTLENLRYASFDISHLQSLAKLKVLKIRFEGILSGVHDQQQCEDIDFSQAFASLKTMEISFVEGPTVVPNQIFDVLSQLQGLRELKLNLCDLNDFPWARLTQLRRVFLGWVFVRPLDGLGLLNIIGPLTNLEELESQVIFINGTSSLWSLTEVEFSKIVKLVELRAHVLTLRCHYDFIYEENCNEKRKVILIKP